MRAFWAAGIAAIVGVWQGACGRTVLYSEAIDSPGLIYYLPKTIVDLTIEARGTLDSDHFDLRYVEIKSVVPREIADPSRAYSLHYEPSAASHDRVCMGVSPKGLLQSVEVAADDKTGDIIVSLARLAGRFVNIGGFADAKQAQPPQGETIRTMTIEIDPLNRTHWAQVNRAMVAAFGPRARDYRFKVDDIEHLVRDAEAPDTCPDNMVCYRSKVPVRFTLSTAYGPVHGKYAEIVNRRVSGRIDVSRALMVEKITKLSFSDGVLVAANIKKPSEGLALAKLPLTVVDAVMTSALAAPGEFVSKASGLASATSLYEQAFKNTETIAKMQVELSKIRNEGFTDNDPVASDSRAFKLECTVPGKSVPPKPS